MMRSSGTGVGMLAMISMSLTCKQSLSMCMIVESALTLYLLVHRAYLPSPLNLISVDGVDVITVDGVSVDVICVLDIVTYGGSSNIQCPGISTFSQVSVRSSTQLT